MGLKKVLLASAAVVVGLATADAAQAGGVYGTFSGGLNWTDSVKATGPSTTIDTSAQEGFVVSVAVGWHLDDVVMKGLRVELEGAYRHNHQPGTGVISSTSGVTQTTSTWSVMGNVWYDFDMGSSIKPYFGGGIGWARDKFIPKPFTVAPTIENEGFAWQAGAGINVAISPAASIGLGYRYMDTDGIGSTPAGVDLGDLTHSSLEFTINYDLN